MKSACKKVPHNRHLKRYRDGFRIAQEQAKRCDDDDSDDSEKVSAMFLSRALDVRVFIKTRRPRDVRETTVQDGTVEETQRGGGQLGEIEHQQGVSRVYENREEGKTGGVSRPERTTSAGVEEESGRAERDEEEKEEEEERTREFEQQQQQQQLERK